MDFQCLVDNHRQDNTVLSCWWCEQSWRQSPTVFSSHRYIADWTVSSSPLCGVDTFANKSCSHRIAKSRGLVLCNKKYICNAKFTLLTWTRQDCLVAPCLVGGVIRVCNILWQFSVVLSTVTSELITRRTRHMWRVHCLVITVWQVHCTLWQSLWRVHCDEFTFWWKSELVTCDEFSVWRVHCEPSIYWMATEQSAVWTPLQTVPFRPHFETEQNCRSLNMFSLDIFCRRQSWLVTSSVHTTNTDKTRQCVILCVCGVHKTQPAQWTNPLCLRHQRRRFCLCRRYKQLSCLLCLRNGDWAWWPVRRYYLFVLSIVTETNSVWLFADVLL